MCGRKGELMPSPILLSTGAASLIGFLLNSTILFLVLRRGRQLYHYLFGGVLLICALWDLGILLAVVRNNHPNELILYGSIINYPCSFLPALVFHFTHAYLGKKRPLVIGALWILGVLSVALGVAGLFGNVRGVYSYSWGNIFRFGDGFSVELIAILTIWILTFGSACGLLYKAYTYERDSLRRRHTFYVFVGLIAIGTAVVKVIVTMGYDLAFLMPLGMFMNDVFSAVIGLAIVKEGLFDITVIITRGAIYSGLAASVIFIFSLSEHLLASFLGEVIGQESQLLHILSIAIVIAVFMPIKHRLESTVNGFFSQRRLEF
jgi:hypothetical protein